MILTILECSVLAILVIAIVVGFIFGAAFIVSLVDDFGKFVLQIQNSEGEWNELNGGTPKDAEEIIKALRDAKRNYAGRKCDFRVVKYRAVRKKLEKCYFVEIKLANKWVRYHKNPESMETCLRWAKELSSETGQQVQVRRKWTRKSLPAGLI